MHLASFRKPSKKGTDPFFVRLFPACLGLVVDSELPFPPWAEFMERAARLIKNKKISADIVTPEDLIRAAWPVAVGRIIALHTLRIRLVRTTLVVEVEDTIWQRQLFTLRHQILRQLGKVTGDCLATEMEFRVGAQRIQPQRAQTRVSTVSGDESDAIRDPVLKKVYQLSRKKATA